MNFKARKGQSAIEYLMTYGWMLLVVAIVGTAIYTTASGCSKNVAPAPGADVKVADFAVNDNRLQLELENGGGEPITVDDVGIYNSETGSLVTSASPGLDINVGESKVVEFTAITQADACSTFDVKINATKGSLNPTSKATITGGMSG